jgi:hypothetical protein
VKKIMDKGKTEKKKSQKKKTVKKKEQNTAIAKKMPEDPELGKTEKKLKFIELRAKGLSYRQIEQELNIGRSACGEWNEELKEEIVKRKAEYLEELYHNYYMLREARIEKLGDIFKKLDKELASRDITDLSTKELLDYYLKYLSELKEEYIDLKSTKSRLKSDSQDILREFSDLLNRVRAGDITKDQAVKENYVLANLLKAYEILIVEKKIDSIKSIIGGRPDEKVKF